MKLGIIADTHIPERADKIPQKILESFREVDLIIHAGDLVDLSVLDTLNSVCGNVKAVCGNMDSYKVRAKLPEKEIIKIGNYRIGVMHGYGSPENMVGLLTEKFKNDNVNLIIFGHSHVATSVERGDILYFNPGSPTDNVFSPFNSYGLIEINDKIEAHIVKL